MHHESIRSQLIPGTMVEVTQQIPHRNRTWTNTVRGTVTAYEQKQTGSWFAHAKDDKLWLDRLTIRKDDGEISDLVLDRYTHVEVVDAAGAEAQSG